MRRLLVIAVVIALVVGVPLARALLDGGHAPEVEVEPVQSRTVRSSVLASGYLQHEDEVQLTPEEIGRVAEVLVREGSIVTQGQLLLRIDDETHRAAVEQNRAQVRVQELAIERQRVRLVNLQSQWERQNRLHEQRLIDNDGFEAFTNELALAELELQSSRESLSQARAQLEQAEDRLRKTRVLAPMAGMVTSLDIKVGETAIASATNVPGSSLMTIANPDSILTEVNVDEADIANVDVGHRALVYAVAWPDRPVEGVVESIAVSARVPDGGQGRSFAVRIRLDPQDGMRLRPGMSCRAEIFTTALDDVLAVPIQSIRVEEDRTLGNTTYSVFVHRGGRVSRREVDVGLSDDTYQEVRSGLGAGDEVVVGPDRVLRSLTDGAAVKVSSPVGG